MQEGDHEIDIVSIFKKGWVGEIFEVCLECTKYSCVGLAFNAHQHPV